MKVSIIIPFYGRWDLTHARMMELYTHVQTECSIVLVDDCSEGEEHVGGVAWWQKQINKHSVYYLRNTKNLGFGWSMNRGAKIALKHGAEILVFLSNDVQIFNDFVAEIVSWVEQDKNVLIGAELLDRDTGWNVLDGKVIPYLTGWLLACHRDVWKELGGFDMRYGRHDYEDIDLSLTAATKGYAFRVLEKSKLRHMAAQTAPYDVARERITKENQQKFIKKWRVAI